MKYIVAFDPSVTMWGWVLLGLRDTGKIFVVDSGVIKTESESKKRKIRKGGDDIRRILELYRTLTCLFKEHDISLVVSEQPHGSQNAAAAKMIGVCLAVVTALCTHYEVPVEWYLESECKRHLTGKKAVTKKEIQDAVSKKYLLDKVWRGVKYIDEAVGDAMAVFHCAEKESEMLKLLKRN
jgi:Holliday junction resolvasome RuvABC endonuclease subunit